MLHRHRIPEAFISHAGKRASRLGLWHRIYHGEPVPDSGLSLHDQRPVQMLAALGRQKQPSLLHCAVNTVKYRLCRLHTGKGSDPLSCHLTGRASHCQNVPLIQLCLIEKLPQRLPGLLFHSLEEILFHPSVRHSCLRHFSSPFSLSLPSLHSSLFSSPLRRDISMENIPYLSCHR